MLTLVFILGLVILYLHTYVHFYVHPSNELITMEDVYRQELTSQIYMKLPVLFHAKTIRREPDLKYVEAIQKDGLEADLSAYIPSAVPAKEVNQLLTAGILQHLREKSVLLSSIGGGIEVKLLKDNITIDLSDTALKEVIAEYIRKDFRDYIFGA